MKKITEISKVYKDERKNIDAGFAKIFEQSIRIVDKVGSTVEIPRIASRQQHRSNAVTTTPCS